MSQTDARTAAFRLVAQQGLFCDVRTVEIPSAPHIKKRAANAVIADIDSGSPAAKAGLREGDVIQEVNKRPITNAKELVAISKKLNPNEKILMRVYSQGRSGYVALEAK